MDIHDDHPDLPRLAAEGRVVAYFGYGSLVNRRTLRTKFLGIRRASVAGRTQAMTRAAHGDQRGSGPGTAAVSSGVARTPG